MADSPAVPDGAVAAVDEALAAARAQLAALRDALAAVVADVRELDGASTIKSA
ncbi:MAG: hypothetical protein Q7V57_19635 [Actinomycetota bacterium]|nr:hypothetical protein [Actinomycetota bacterium]